MIVDTDEDTWWVIGDREGNYLHWKGNSISGCYVPWRDAETAERYENPESAWAAIDSDEDVRRALDDLQGRATVLKVTARVRVTTTGRRRK